MNASDRTDSALLHAALLASALDTHEEALAHAATIAARFEAAGHDADSDLYTRALVDPRYLARVQFVRATMAFIVAARRYDAAARAEPNARRASSNGEPSSRAALQGEARHAGTGSETPADREARSEGRGVNAPATIIHLADRRAAG